MRNTNLLSKFINCIFVQNFIIVSKDYKALGYSILLLYV